jgi:CxxC motif-containing protein (DUF1111 family)
MPAKKSIHTRGRGRGRPPIAGGASICIQVRLPTHTRTAIERACQHYGIPLSTAVRWGVQAWLDAGAPVPANPTPKNTSA